MKSLNRSVQGHSKRNAKVKWLSMLQKQGIEFCRETGLHGYKYVGQAQRSKIERIIWAIMVFTSLCSAIVLMKFAWDYYRTHPTLTVIESTHHGIWNYPFPAVTVCDINRVSLKLTRELVDKLTIPSHLSKDFVVDEMRLLNELLFPGSYPYSVKKNLSRLQNIIDDNNLSIPQVVDSVTRDCKDLIQSCKWKGNVIDCSVLFHKSLSRKGLCCSFNYITSETIANLDSAEPKRITSCGYQTGLTILLDIEPTDYHATMLGTVGVNVLLHDPYSYPDYNAPNKLLNMNTQMFLTVEPEETYTTLSVKDLSISTRRCIFDDEESKIMKKFATERNFTFPKYSYLNCMAECRSTVIRAKCGCIPYYIPQNVTKTCNLRDVPCLATYKSSYETAWPGSNITTRMLRDSILTITERPCNCMPDCNFFRYIIESSSGYLDDKLYTRNLSYTNIASRGVPLKNRSIIHIFFGDLVSTQYRRNIHYNWRNLFATFGGLLGLFSGFSLMSVFELIYFFIIRVIINAWTKTRKTMDSQNF